MDEGQKLFGSNCATCHGMDATGGGIRGVRTRVGAGVDERRIGGEGGVRGEGHGSFVGSMGSRVRVTSTVRS
ncbi:c-type cytochrome [Clavibacter lycopersici]|uniref:c-type cytochrome n=1 Tax=Clavibacter lycopersici TaxID=2301718 RepID=UPI001F2A8C2C